MIIRVRVVNFDMSPCMSFKRSQMWYWLLFDGCRS